MDIKQSLPTVTVSTDVKATLNDISECVGNLPENLYADVAAQGLEPAGPMVFAYRGVDGNPNTAFDIDIALPVRLSSPEDYKGNYSIKTLSPFDYVERIHQGSVKNIGAEAYGPFYVDLGKAGMPLTGELREVYSHWVDADSEENVTAIQIGVKR